MEFSLAESLSVADRMARIFEALGVPYAIGGSVASSLHGFPRSTMDVDFVSGMRPLHTAPFTDALGSDFYFADEAIEHAVAHRDTFNVIELITMLKVDVFVARPDQSAQLERAQPIATEGGYRFRVVTPEDIVAEKLRWFRLGDETSDRQWKDLTGVIEVQGSALRLQLLKDQCELLGVADLLDRALEQVNQRSGA